MFHFNVDGKLVYGSRRVIKTKEEARMIFEELHSSPIGGHTGIGKTRAAICARFYWYGMCVLTLKIGYVLFYAVILVYVSAHVCICMYVCMYIFLSDRYWNVSYVKK